MCFKRHLRSSLSSSSSSSCIGYNEDLVTIISLYLPVRSILRFRSVSKKWYSILTHTRFIHCYASNHSRKSSLLLRHPYKNKFFFPLKENRSSFDFGFDFKSLKKSRSDSLYLKRSCHGLLLFYIRRGHNQPGEGRTYYICNPSTRKYTELAIPDFLTKASVHFSVHLAFDPSKLPHYKVIFFWNDRIDQRPILDYHITIYSSETRTCKTLGSKCYNKDYMALDSGVFLNGAIFCVSCPVMITTTPSIFYFDINQETFRTFPGPPIVSRTKFLGACQGRLHLILSHHREHVFDVYELKEDFSSWFVKYKVDLHAIAAYFPEILIDKYNTKKYSVCCFLEKHEEEDPTIVLIFKNHRLPIAYNLIDKTAKLFDLPASYASFQGSRWIQCIESLFCV